MLHHPLIVHHLTVLSDIRTFYHSSRHVNLYFLVDRDATVSRCAYPSQCIVVQFGVDMQHDSFINGRHRLSDCLVLKVESCADDGDRISLQVTTKGCIRAVHRDKLLQLYRKGLSISEIQKKEYGEERRPTCATINDSVVRTK